ncbi:hypothetical protein GALMADRAFT_241975 [Galerina marginata CBS 339.88]|uniref:Major facilitator superfamily (MFS) profile domain-containing protein n=1 Tax=Galerina marginata (strain CBS 339.88) TaxID=685588 RepID=A0A067TIY7_GALM3|nr:hypothetical protein GALMADRAFT_241975 [Galerina marginata CBS 339.88]
MASYLSSEVAATRSQTPESLDVEKKGQITVNSQPPLEFPDGGTQAWLNLLGSFLTQFVTFGYISAFGVYQDFYIREYLTDYSPSDIGWIGGVQILFTFSSGILVGRAFDRGYFRWLISAGAILNALALFMLSLSHKNSFYQVFLTNGVALGLSAGLCYIPSLGIPTQYFLKHRALALGISASGSALGAVLHPIMLNHFFNGPIGFHNGVRISGALNLSLFIVALSLMRTRLPPKTVQQFPVRSWLKEPAYLAMFIGGWFVFLGLFYPIFYLQLSAITHGVNRNFAFYSISILNSASVFGRVIPGIIAPRLGVFNLIVLSTISSGIVATCMVLAKDAVSTTMIAIFYGFFSGAAVGLVPAVVGQLSAHMNEFGTRMGIIFFCAGILGLFATPIAGALLTDQYHWIRADLFAGIALILAGFCFAMSRYFVAKQRGTQRL